jgi:hypothetical protein
MENKSLISVTTLRKLLHEIRDKRPDTGIRFRMLGEMWGRNFMRVESVGSKGVLLKDEHDHKLVSVYDITNVMQFELDNSFYGFQAYFHYEVTPVPELTQFRSSSNA